MDVVLFGVLREIVKHPKYQLDAVNIGVRRGTPPFNLKLFSCSPEILYILFWYRSYVRIKFLP